jgi:hypothetical protein
MKLKAIGLRPFEGKPSAVGGLRQRSLRHGKKEIRVMGCGLSVRNWS